MSEFVQQWPVPTYGFDTVMDNALPYPSRMEQAWRISILHVPAGSSAWNPGTTKHVIYGECWLQYDIHPSGIICRHLDKPQFDEMAARLEQVREAFDPKADES